MQTSHDRVVNIIVNLKQRNNYEVSTIFSKYESARKKIPAQNVVLLACVNSLRKLRRDQRFAAGPTERMRKRIRSADPAVFTVIHLHQKSISN